MADTNLAAALAASSNNQDATSSSADAPSPEERRIESSAPETINEGPQEDDAIPEDRFIEADDGDSTLGDNASTSTGTSISSSAIRGHIENGRRYSSLRGEGEVWCPSDEKSFEAFETTHLMWLILDSQRRNVLFQSPISKKAQNVLDVGTGDASWALDTADKFPNLTVLGVDIYPPPKTWVAPNCVLEVDDLAKDWSFSHKFDLIHVRMLMGAWNVQEWKRFYQQAYDNLEPGGWIEQVEININILSDDSTLPADSHLAKFGSIFEACGRKAGKPLDICDRFEDWIKEAGFTNVQKTEYKVPCGEWPKLPVYKDVGRVCLKTFKQGLEGWVIWFLTHYGDPEPWTIEQVQVYLALMRKELDSNWHIYQRAKRVCAQKPFDAPTAKKAQAAELESLS